jgi:Cu+-exporting ATPase
VPKGDEAASVKDPVCGMQVDPATAAASEVHDGRTYPFCSLACRDQFLADPGAYA